MRQFRNASLQQKKVLDEARFKVTLGYKAVLLVFAEILPLGME